MFVDPAQAPAELMEPSMEPGQSPSRSRAGTASHLLAAVADALAACEQAGLKVRLRHGIVETREGYVLPVKGGWVARTRAWTEFSPADDGDEEP